MPFAPHWRLTAQGPLHDGAERFSFGLALAGADGNGDNLGAFQPDNDQFEDLCTDLSNFFTRPASRISPFAKIDMVKLAWIGADGRYTRDPFVKEYLGAARPTGGGTLIGQDYPPQIALACSLGTARRGASGRGRFFLPIPKVAIVAGGIADAAQVAEVQASVVTLIDDINNEPDIDVVNWGVCVASSKGYNSRVTNVRVGRAFDTIRSRRRSLLEQYAPETPVQIPEQGA